MAEKDRFFELPLELRNIIYGLLAPPRHYRDGSWKTCDSCSTCRHSKRISRTLDTSILRVSKQFKSEYEQEAFRKARLSTFVNTGIKTALVATPKMPIHTFTSIRHIEFWVTVVPPYDLADFLGDEHLFFRMCFFPAMKTLKIFFRAEANDNRRLLEFAEQLSELCSRAQTIREDCKRVFKEVEVETACLLKTRLYQPIILGAPANVPQEAIDDLLDEMDDKVGNRAIYRATPSQLGDPYAFHGVQLELDSCGQANAQAWDELIKDRLSGYAQV